MKSESNTPLDRLNKLALLGTTALIASFGAIPAAYAQDNPASEVEEDGDEVVATGIRSALETARDLKRDADTAIDSITASDVGALPDLSVAEALARVPGVVVQRFELGANGGDFPSPEGGGNLIRGLTLVRSEFNGRDTFSANGGRSLDFGTIPPELIGAVDVYKNTSADLIEGGIGGSINLRTLEPFDKTGNFLAASVDGTYTDLRDEWAPDYSVIGSTRWDGKRGEFGILGSFSSSELKSDLNGFQVGPLLSLPTAPEFQGPGRVDVPADAERIAVPGGFQLRTNEVDRKRDSYYLAGQWQNNEGTFKATAKWARIENTVDSDERTLEWFGDGESWGDPAANPQQTSLQGDSLTNLIGDFTSTPFTSNGLAACNGSNDPNAGLALCETTYPVTGLYQTGVISNELRDWIGARGANFTNLGIHQTDESTTEDLSFNVKWRPSDRLFVEGDWHRTKATFDQSRVWGGTRFFSDFSLVPDLDNPQVTLIPDPANAPRRRFADGTEAGEWSGGDALSTDLSDPANAFLLFAADQFQQNEGDMDAFRADVEYEFEDSGWFESVKFGARFADREQINRQAGLNWGAVAPPWQGATNNTYLPLAELSNFGYETVDFSDFFRGGVVQGENTSVLFVDRDLLQDYPAFVSALRSEPLIVGDSPGQIGQWTPLGGQGGINYPSPNSVREKTQNFYTRVDFGNEFDNGMSVEGNVGVRYTKADVSGVGGLRYQTNDDARVAQFAPDAVAYLQQADVERDGEFQSNDFWLPSLNVKWNVSDETLLRLGVSKNITRPNIAQLRDDQVAIGAFAFQTNEDVVPAEVTNIIPTAINLYGGNPNLKPIESWNYDLSAEHYWGDSNSLTLSLFYKDLTNNIVYGSQTQDVISLDGSEVPIILNSDFNQDEAKIKGLEIAYQHFFDGLPGLLANTGIQANYTYIDAKTNPPAPFDGTENPDFADGFLTIYRFDVDNFLGLSDHAANIIGIYEDEKIEFRMAYNWRSEYLSSYRDFVSGNPIFQEDRGYLDGSFKYNFNDNLQFRAQIANILDTKAKATQQIDAEGQRFARTSFVGDRRIRVGLRYQF